MSVNERKYGIHTEYIPFYTATTDLINKTFEPKITLREIRMEGNLTRLDKTTVSINAKPRNHYGHFCIYPDELCRSLVVTPVFSQERAGMLVLIYEGYDFETTPVGIEDPFLEPKTLGKEITLHPSAARTATGQTAWFYEFRFVGEVIAFILDITAASGTTPTLDVTVENYDPVSGKTDTAMTFAQKNSVATEWKYAADTNKKFGNIMRVKYTIGGTTPSFTFSVSAIVKS